MFHIEAYCILMNRKANTRVPADSPLQRSCVKSDYIKAERFFASSKPGELNPTRISRDRLKCLFKHELGHYKITRLIALDLFRAVLEQSQGPRFPSAEAAIAKFNALEAEYIFIRELVQATYELVTNFGRNEGEQQRWTELLEKADTDAGDWRARTSRVGPNRRFWPGLEYNLSSPGVTQIEMDLAKNLLSIYGTGKNPNHQAAQAFKTQLDQQINAAKSTAQSAAAKSAAHPQPSAHP
jgi:hypothetical protein